MFEVGILFISAQHGKLLFLFLGQINSKLRNKLKYDKLSEDKLIAYQARELKSKFETTNLIKCF